MDFGLRIATASLAFAAMAVALGRPGPRPLRAMIALAIGGIGAFMIASAPGVLRELGLVSFVFNAWCLANPAVVWIAACLLFRDQPRPTLAQLAITGALVAVTLAADYGRDGLGPLGEWPGLAHALLVAGRVAAIGLLVAACLAAAATWRADLVEPRRAARAPFVLAIGGVFIVAASSHAFFPTGGPPEVLIAGHAALLALSFALVVLLARGALDGLLASSQPAVPPILSVVPTARSPFGEHAVRPGAEAALAQRVAAEMQARRLWKRERLCIADLARELGTQEYLLRRAINRHLGYRNFNDFLHDYRLKEAAERLAASGERHLPVLSIALDCGYGSIGPFNRAFKARFGVTPTQYRNLREHEQSMADSGTGAM